MQDNEFKIIFSDFSTGFAPLAHLDSLTSLGNRGDASVMVNADIISRPQWLTQGPGLSTLTNGTQAGAVTDQINFILDKAVANNATYGISDTLLHKISASTVTNTGSFPHTITGATDGSSCIHFQGKLFYFYNKSSGADCGMFDLSSTFDDVYFSTNVTVGAGALQKAPHPVAKKEDIMLFGNGRYVGTYISTTDTLVRQKLDFGQDTEVADVAFHANQWFIAVNSGQTTGTNRASSQIYLYSGAAISTLLSDEVALGLQQIGFIMPVNGVIYVAYKELSSTGGFAIGYVQGRQIKALKHFAGSLPAFSQKSLYQNTILFISNGLVYSVGAVVDQMPIQISQLADGGYATVGALSAPFGTPMLASTESTNFKLAKFANYDTNSSWKSIVIPTTQGRLVGMIDECVVFTNALGTGASCAIAIEDNQAGTTTAVGTVNTVGKTRHYLKKAIQNVEDFRLTVSFSGGSTTNPVEIREVFIRGHYVEK